MNSSSTNVSIEDYLIQQVVHILLILFFEQLIHIIVIFGLEALEFGLQRLTLLPILNKTLN